VLFHADAVLECFFKHALEDFLIGRVLEADLHPEFCSPRIATYVLVKKPETRFAHSPVNVDFNLVLGLKPGLFIIGTFKQLQVRGGEQPCLRSVMTLLIVSLLGGPFFVINVSLSF